MAVDTERLGVREETFGQYAASLQKNDGILFGDMKRGVFMQLVDSNRISVLDVTENNMNPFESVDLPPGELYGKDFDGKTILVEGIGANETVTEIMVSVPDSVRALVVRSRHGRR